MELSRALDEQKELTVQVPRGAQLLAAASDGHELSWHVERSADRIDRTGRHSAAAGNRSLRLRSDCPRLVSSRSGSALVATCPPPRYSRLEHGSQRVNAVRTVQVGESEIDRCRPNWGHAKHGDLGCSRKSYTFESDSPTASITVDIARRQPTAKVRMGSSLVLADPDVTGRLVTEWNVSNDYLHRLSGELAEGWTVETVESIPAEAMAEWFIDTNGSQRRLEVQLTGSAGPDRDVSIIVMGRLQRPGLAAPIAADTLRMVKWSNARVTQHLLTFQSTEPFAIDSIGHLPSVAVDTLSKNDQELVDGITKDSRIVDLSQAGPGAGLQLAFKRGEYSADVKLVATYDFGTLHQTYMVRVEPNGDSIDRLLVFATSPLGNATHWTLSPTDAPIVAERILADDPQRKDLPKEGELWLLRLPQPTTTAVEISATVTNTWPNRSKVPLLGLPEAVTQTGRAELRASLADSPTLDVDRLIPIPLPVGGSKPGFAVAPLPVAAYRYTPRDCLTTSRQPTLWIGTGAGRRHFFAHRKLFGPGIVLFVERPGPTSCCVFADQFRRDNTPTGSATRSDSVVCFGQRPSRGCHTATRRATGLNSPATGNKIDHGIDFIFNRGNTALRGLFIAATRWSKRVADTCRRMESLVAGRILSHNTDSVR